MKFTTTPMRLVREEVAPVASHRCEDGTLFLDFGRDAFATVQLSSLAHDARLVFHLGEKLDTHGRIDREPPGTIRYIRIEHNVVAGSGPSSLQIPPDERNTGPAAIGMPGYIGEVLPFRYVEIENAVDIHPHQIHQMAVHYPFDDTASGFECSLSGLNSVWDLCKYSIKATSFCGIYVDGDRERIPYEGDAYINQLCHYCVDSEYQMARYSHEYLIQRPTWCTEWHLHSVMMAWADYMYSGEKVSLATFYDQLCAKTLVAFAREDGLISVEPEVRTESVSKRIAPHIESGVIKTDIRDVIDWPPGSFTEGGIGERDGFDMVAYNTVVNAFHCHTLHLMSRIANVLGKRDDQQQFQQQADKVQATINALLFDSERGVYIDGEGSDHAALHSNMFMLAFDLVPAERISTVIDFVKSRGMACSVYGAQHLLDALFQHGEDRYAVDLMAARHDRSWLNMVDAGSTITLEAWDLKYKGNLDWNHAWGAAPANILPRYVLGVRPLGPGFRRTLIAPQPGGLSSAHGRVPTPLGPVDIAWAVGADGTFELNVTVPNGMYVQLSLPLGEHKRSVLTIDGVKSDYTVSGSRAVASDLSDGHYKTVFSISD